MEPLTEFEIAGKRFPFGAKRCTCEEAQTWWAEYDRQKAEEKRLEEERERRARLDRLFQLSMLPTRWKSRTFESFEVTNDNRDAFQTAKEYVEQFRPSEGKGLIFTGTVGLGKTHLSAAIAMELLSREYSAVFGTVTTLLDEFRSAYDNDRIHHADVMRQLTRCDLLIVDDLGKEKVTDWVEQMVYELINTRYENNKSLIVTTNMTLTDIRDKYTERGAAIVSRILEMCKGVKMTGRDRRRMNIAI
ncbi:ATP-binding protein [Alicyclobacillus fastidiosus]|uniref:ATP-binding protein n=1 Tax=Alicyclobacillus fastidiosus TaxID=392011 RepID=A0ABV5ALK6_9BACL|nr:ATP-binding protein [Alicyclobacillus fastidiosus]WEH08508.1 ATP-binding protein [Alicyclobacillus fastidiosus]